MGRTLSSKFTKLILVSILVLSLTLSCSCSPSSPPPPDKPRPVSGPIKTKPLLKTNFSFVVFGDNRPAGPKDPQPEVFKKIVTQINKENSELVFNTGDMVAGQTNSYNQYKKQYLDFLKVMRKLKTPFHIAAGNHDIDNQLGQRLYQNLINRKLYYSLNYKSSHFIILNTEIVGQEGQIGPEQLSWLRNDLRNHQNSRHIFVFMHRPLYSVMNPESKRGRHMAFTNIQNRATLRELMKKYKVDITFAGHEHFFNQQIHNDTTYIITGCAGASPYTNAKYGGFPHYVVVKVSGEKVSLTVVKASGQRLKPDSIPAPRF